MANVKITELTAETNPVSTDVLPIVDVSADTTKKVTIADLLENAGNGSAGSPAFAFDGDSDTGMYRVDTNKLGFATAGTGRLFIDANGNIGIGTATPGYFFHVRNASAFSTNFEVTGKGEFRIIPAVDANGHAIRFGGSSGGTTEPRILRFLTSGDVERMRLDSSGRLLLGTSSATNYANRTGMFQIAGGSNTHMALARSTDDNNESSFTFAKSRGTQASPTSVNDDDTLGRLRFAGFDGTDYNSIAAEIKVAVDGTPGTNDMPGRLIFSTTADGSSSPTTRMVIDSGGRVGVGTTSPGANLDIRGSGHNPTINLVRTDAQTAGGIQLASGDNANYVQSLGAKDFQISTNSSEKLRVTSAGNVGIGTSSPGSLLELRKNEATRLRLTRTNAVSNYCQIEAAGSNSEQLTITTDPTGQGSGFIAFENNGSERMRLDSSGNVGIGTNSPVARLHAKVDGTGTDIQKWTADLGVNTRDMVVKSPAADNNDDPFTFQTSNSIAFQIDTSEAVRIDAAGRLGVGTNNPQSVLHTTGTRDYTGTTPTKSSYDNNFQSGNAYVAIGQSNSIPAIQGHGSGTSFNLALAPNAGNVAIGSTDADSALTVKARTNIPPFKVSGPSSEFARIDPLGRLLVGTSAYTSAGDSFSPENLVYVENAGDSGFQTFVGIANRSDTVGASIVLGKTRGTAVGSNTIVQDNDQLGIVKFVGADGVDRSPVAAAIECEVDGTPGSNDMPGRLVFQTTSDSGASPTTRMTIDSQGALNIFNGTAPTASATNGVKLYAQDVSSSSELKVRDEAGNVTTLSPHNFDLIPEGPSEDMAWSYYSERDGKRINVDMLKAIRLLEQLSGEQLVFTS